MMVDVSNPLVGEFVAKRSSVSNLLERWDGVAVKYKILHELPGGSYMAQPFRRHANHEDIWEPLDHRVILTSQELSSFDERCNPKWVICDADLDCRSDYRIELNAAKKEQVA